MAKGIIKPGRVVILLSGRLAGKKAIIVRNYDDGQKKGRKFPHALVAGIAKSPKQVTKRMGKKKIAEKLKVRPFMKVVNYSHLMPTRYVVTGEIEPKNVAPIDEPNKAEYVKKQKNMLLELKTLLEDKYKALPSLKSEKASHVDFFFRKLNF